MKSDDDVVAAFVSMWKDCKRRIGGKSSAWTNEGIKGRMQGIEDCAHAAGIWSKFSKARDGKPIRDIPGQMMLDAVPGFAPPPAQRED